MFFTWDESLDTGIAVIDDQHKRIVDYINDLHAAIANKDREAVSGVLDQLINYTVTHFSFEESLMEKHGYIHTDAHRSVHDAFTSRILKYQQELESGKDISRKLLNDLKIWLSSHIKSEDSDYVKSINQRVDKGWLSKALGRFFGK